MVRSGDGFGRIDIEPLPDRTFEPVAAESDFADLEVIGDLPHSLRGSYLRNGANPEVRTPRPVPRVRWRRLLHSVTLDEGRASYRNRYVVWRGLAAKRRAGRSLFGGLAEFRAPEPDIVAEAGFMNNARSEPHSGSANQFA